MMSWSVIALSQVGLKGKAGFYVTRALLGLLEGYVAKTLFSVKPESRLTPL